MEAIKTWLSGDKDYTVGVALLAKHSKNRILLQNLSRKQLPEKLEYELRKLSNEPFRMPSAPIQKKESIPEIVKVGRMLKIDPDTLPEHLKKLWDETAETYRIARALHEQLKQTTTADQRIEGIARMEDYRKEIRANWEVIDAWALEQKGGPKNTTVDNHRINANRKYLSDGKKALEKLSGASRAMKLEAMQRRINELISVNEKFDPTNQKELEELGMKFNA